MAPYTQYRKGSSGLAADADTDRTPSPNIWADCPWDELRNSMDGGTKQGYAFFDDFISFLPEATGAVTDGIVGPYVFSTDTGVTVQSTAASDHGIIVADGLDTAADGMSMQHGFESGFARLGANDRMWFEARVKTDVLTDQETGFFVGLYAQSVSDGALNVIANTTGIMDADQDSVGFLNNFTDGDIVELHYQEGSNTAQNVGKGTTNAVGSGTEITLVADTFVKLGMKFYGLGTSSLAQGDQGRIEYFENGRLIAWYDIASTANWPDTNHLALTFAAKAGTAAAGAGTASMDWWKIATMAE